MKKEHKVFGVLQRVGRSFMLPLALLPIAGLLLGIGSSFTNETMLAAYGLSHVIYKGGALYTILDIMSKTGSAVFNNLPLLFAIGVSIGMAKKEKAVAALSSAVAYLIMNTAISTLITAKGGVSAMPANSTISVLGITTLQMGVFGGIIVGLGVAALHNRFYEIQLPQVLSFFGGTHFIPIISSVTFLLVGILMFFVWPIIQTGIAALGSLVLGSGYLGTWIYGVIERALIPFGLHHVFYLPFWQTAVGGTATIDGNVVSGAQNIFFAELVSKSTQQFSVSATRFMSGKFPLMIFGLPGAALAMYKCARKDKRKEVGGLLLSAALTSMLTGITEPIEFTFLFVATPLYAVHCVLAGASYMLMHILNVGVGMTFSGGLIDLTLFGIMQGNAKTHWIWVIIIGIAYFFLYYFLFRFMIRKFNYKTPGRDDDAEVKLYTRADVDEKRKSQKSGGDAVSALILRGLGGKTNLVDLDSCATRLRVTVSDSSKVDQSLLKQSGASGVICRGDGIQVVYGPQVSVIKSKLEDYMDTPESDQPDAVASPVAAKAEKVSGTKKKDVMLSACMNGTATPIEKVNDEAFASCVLGKGAAIEPADGCLYAPADGTISTLFDTKHAVGMTTDDGAEVLMHIGIDTVKLDGKYYEYHVRKDEKVHKGDLLVTFDLEAVKAAGYQTTTPVIVCNTDDYQSVQLAASGNVKVGDDFLQLKA
ncbi:MULTISPECIES: PTS transporter subunit IIABC [Caproicibacterium]|jgi:PTS system D-glucosamine-specific IIC component|uniref:PTS glucose transporter subunit IIA n=1 Tax=Caproicibacterium lactatifermentans TaxID=2666138 RepID=A0ABX6PUY7_9FIRM|nr:PTS transporter subunit IIABC [Caproicibacterium lactatifermentans]ARP51048.1 PTS glucose transporter subunit IIA [Ruminococcaceae bacterium CPB6]QKO30092.1 PTS glucose transporter subunit IIA [Caproicibacterium lactatifermentans]